MGRAHRIINNDRRTGSLREFDYLPNILLVVAVCQVNIVARVPVAGTRDAESLGSIDDKSGFRGTREILMARMFELDVCTHATGFLVCPASRRFVETRNIANIGSSKQLCVRCTLIWNPKFGCSWMSLTIRADYYGRQLLLDCLNRNLLHALNIITRISL